MGFLSCLKLISWYATFTWWWPLLVHKAYWRKEESVSLSGFTASNVGYCAFYWDLTLLVELWDLVYTGVSIHCAYIWFWLSGNFANSQQSNKFCYILNGQRQNFEKVTNFCYNLNQLWQNFGKSLCCVKVQMDHFCGSTSQVSAVWAVLLWIWFMNGPQLWSSFWIFPASPHVL